MEIITGEFNSEKLLRKSELTLGAQSALIPDIHFLPQDINLLNLAEQQWKEIENFNFQKMDVDATLKKLVSNSLLL